MEETVVKAKPKQPKIVTRVSNIENLQKSVDDLNTTSRRLRRLFERNSYQKRTQLPVLKRYKRQLDSIERAEEERARRASKKKIKLPTIKKFAGSFFAPDASKDPFKAIGALAAFNSLEKIASGDLLGALGPGLVAAGMVAGPSLIGVGVSAGMDKILGRNKLRRGFDVTGRRVSQGAQERYLSRYGDKAFKNRFGADALKKSQQAASSTATASGGGKVAKAFGRLGKSIIPGVGAVLGAVDAKMRANEGDITGSRIAGASAALDAAAAASAATGIGLVATPFLGLASVTLDLVNFARDITGMSENEAKKKKGIQTKLEEQTKKQKDLVKRKDEGGVGLSFSKTLIGYERVVNKFEEFSKNFKPPEEILDMTEGGPPNPPPPSANPYTGPIDKDSFFPLPGGILSTAAVNIPLGEYGTRRDYEGGHSGQDIGGLPGNSPVVAWKTGTVTVEPGLEGPDNIITIDHGNGVYTKYKHVIATVSNGDTVYGGQQIGKLLPGREEVSGRMYDTHLHFEVWKNGRHINPNTDISASQKIPSPLTRQRAEEEHKKKSTSQPSPPTTPSNSVQPVPGSKYTLRGTTLFKGNDGKYYSTTKGNDGKFLEVDKRNWDYVKKEGELVSFSPKDRNIEMYPSYNDQSSTIAMVYVPQPVRSPQPQSQLSTQFITIGGDTSLNTLASLKRQALSELG
jgi:murein DD-endopeptidase MepM/ murein hydrolase activator NlpD